MKCGICGRELQVGEDHRNCVINDYAKTVDDMDDEIKIYKQALEMACAEILSFDCNIRKDIEYENFRHLLNQEIEIYINNAKIELEEEQNE